MQERVTWETKGLKCCFIGTAWSQMRLKHIGIRVGRVENVQRKESNRIEQCWQISKPIRTILDQNSDFPN